MEENVGRARHGRPSRAHSFARRDVEANAPPKRGRRRQGVQSVQGLVQGTHDSEAGSLAAGGSRRHSSSRQVQVEEEPEVEDASQYINDNADWHSDEDQAVQDQLHVQAPAPHEAPYEGYGGGPRDMSLLSSYH
ncbi:hypothetical protein P8452_05133 [Trifolium repens]|nr:hypothetical protein P8452_05133 [Trifolium repens]